MHSTNEMIEFRSSRIKCFTTLKPTKGLISPVAVHPKICTGVQKDYLHDRPCGLRCWFSYGLPHGTFSAQVDLRAESHLALLAL